MNLLEKLERRLGRFAIPQLTLLLTCLQVIGFAVVTVDHAKSDQMVLTMDRVADGEYWRLGTFFLMPPTTNILLFGFCLWFFYTIGTTLEANWGAFRFNLYIGIGTLATLAVAIVYPSTPVTNEFIGASIFLAFARLYPNFLMSIYFLLPIRIRWLALATWVWYALVITFHDWPERLMVLASVSNYLLFFGGDIFLSVSDHKRRMEWQAKSLRRPDKPFHQCAICGATERTHPRMDFRYCTRCEGSYEYCADHLRAHEHVVKPAASEAPATGGEADIQR